MHLICINREIFVCFGTDVFKKSYNAKFAPKIIQGFSAPLQKISKKKVP